MGKLYLLLIPLVIWGCEQTFDNVVDTSTENYQINNIIFVDHDPPVYDLKNPEDSLLKLRVIFAPQSEVSKVLFDIYASNNIRLNSIPIEMQEVSNKIYENQFILKREYPIGNYIVRFSVTGSNGTNKQVAVGSFYFNNGQDNVAPVISNLVCADSIARGASFIFTITTIDSNGMNDIVSTFFKLFRPDGSIVEESPGDTLFAMHDDGDFEHFGDVTAGDGIYSFKNSFSLTAPTGIWKFVFQAIDRSNSLSNVIQHYILVQ
jgi:hypothetical protein